MKEILEKYNLFDQSIIRHGMLDYMRDYEIIAYINSVDCCREVQYLFKGCISVNYCIKVASEHFSMNDKLLEFDENDNSGNYPAGFVWGVRYAIAYPGLTIIEKNEELDELKLKYGMKFYKVLIETNAYDITLIFHDIDVNVLNKVAKR